MLREVSKNAKFLANVCFDTAGRKRRNALIPIPGRASTSSDALAGECISDCVILTVDMTNGPGAAGGRELQHDIDTKFLEILCNSKNYN